jgi:hypothetical protein
MPLPYRLTLPCYCGTDRDDRGACPHCDRYSQHEPADTDCPACDRIRRRCACCHTIYGSPPAARACEGNDRAAEARRRV